MVAGIDRWVGCIVGGVVVTVYFSAGGLLTAAWVNVVQLAVLFAGFVVVFPLTLNEIGGWSFVVEATRDIEGYWSPLAGRRVRLVLSRDAGPSLYRVAVTFPEGVRRAR